MIVYRSKEEASKPLTKEDIERIEKINNKVVYDAENPPLTEEQLKSGRTKGTVTKEELKQIAIVERKKTQEAEKERIRQQFVALPSWMVDKINSLDAEGEAKLGKFLVSL